MANQTQAELFAHLQAAGLNPYAQGVSQADAELYAKLSAAVSSTNGQAYKNQTLAEEYAALAAAAPLVLDQLSALPAAAYSLRHLTQTYAGPAINVRRDSDNAAMDIGFSGNSLDAVTLLAFCGSGSGYVTKWYNQGTLGSSGDVAQTTATRQPQIVASGVLQTENGQSALVYSSSSDTALVSSNVAITSGGTYSANVVASFNSSGAGAYQALLAHNNGTGQDTFYMRTQPGNGFYTQFEAYESSGTGCIATGTWPAAAQTAAFVSSMTQDNSNVIGYVNGVQFGSKSVAPPMYVGSVPIWVGGNGPSVGFCLNGTVSEAIIFGSALSTADRQTLEHNQESYYGISGS